MQYQYLSTAICLAFSLALYDPLQVQQRIRVLDFPSNAVPVLPTLSGHQVRVTRLNTLRIMGPEQPLPGLHYSGFLQEGAFQLNEIHTSSLPKHLIRGTPLLL